MSNVDLTVFEELSTKFDKAGDLDYLVYCLCEGDFYIDDGALGIIAPDLDGRKWDDPSYQKERAEYLELYEKRVEEVCGYKHLEQEGGGEGGSEYCYGIFKLGDKIYRAEYSYYSYHGHEYDDIMSTLTEVKPVEKTVTIYEPV